MRGKKHFSAISASLRENRGCEGLEKPKAFLAQGRRGRRGNLFWHGFAAGEHTGPPQAEARKARDNSPQANTRVRHRRRHGKLATIRRGEFSLHSPPRGDPGGVEKLSPPHIMRGRDSCLSQRGHQQVPETTSSSARGGWDFLDSTRTTLPPYGTIRSVISWCGIRSRNSGWANTHLPPADRFTRLLAPHP